MAEDPADYSFSSYQINALGKTTDLCTRHDEYLTLGNTKQERQQNYRTLFEYEIDGMLIDNIRKTTNQGMAIGNEAFIKQIEMLTGYNMLSKSRGRPKGWRKRGI